MRSTATHTALRWGLGALFIGAGTVQATHRELFTALMPQPLQEHAGRLQTAMTGALAAIGVTYLVPGWQPVARWATTVVLGGTLPAAIDQVRRPERTDALGLPRPLVVARIPVQALVVAASWYATRPPRG